MLFVIATFLVAFIVTLVTTPLFIRAAKRAGIVGNDVHKAGAPAVPELGGLAIASGLIIALLFAAAASSFTSLQLIFGANLNVEVILAVLCLALIVELIGMIDDVLGLRQHVKLLLPIIAALPLMAVKVSTLHAFVVPFLGPIDLITPTIYLFVLIPIGVIASTNITNTFAGYNGEESGLGSIAAFALLAIGILKGDMLVAVLAAALLGALLAFLRFNWYPAKVFPDDVGTLLIGAMIGAIAIVGGLEVAGAILLLPHAIDFLLFKVPNKLPHAVVQTVLKDGKLHPKGKPLEFAQFIMKSAGGISERGLVLSLLLFEAVLAVAAVAVVMYGM